MALVGAQFVNAVSPNPVGSLQAYAGASAPSGWLLCDGTSYATSVYPELFNVLGYTYGGSGANFNVPDLRGRMPIGPNSDSTAANTATRSIGTKGGDTRLQQHQHYPMAGQTNRARMIDVDVVTGTGTNAGGVYVIRDVGSTGNVTADTATGTGGNMPPFLVTNYIIKAVPDAPRSGLAYGSTPPIVTALPANPQFGDVVTYIADATNGVAWNLQYDATGTYPWKFIGGPALLNANGGQANTAANTNWQDVAEASVTIPLAGDYNVSWNGHAGIAASESAYIGVYANATNPTDGDAGAIYSTANIDAEVARAMKITVTTANTVMKTRVRMSVANARTFSRQSIIATPIRVKAA